MRCFRGTAWVICGRLHPDCFYEMKSLEIPDCVVVTKRWLAFFFFFPASQINSDKQMARSWNYQWLSISLWWFDLFLQWHFVALHLPNLLQNLRCLCLRWNLPEPFHSTVWFSVTDHVSASDAVFHNSHCSHQPNVMIIWPHRFLTDISPQG